METNRLIFTEKIVNSDTYVWNERRMCLRKEPEMAKEKCAGIIAYYYDVTTNQFKFLVAHPGGPFFKNVQKYGFPKGHIEDGEHVKDVAIREFKEETGIDVDYQRL